MSRLSTRAAARLGWGLWFLAFAAMLAWTVLAFLGRDVTASKLPRSSAVETFYNVIMLGFATVGAVIASRRSDNPLGWLFLGLGTSEELTALSVVYARHALTPGSSLPGGELAAWSGEWTIAIALGLLAFLLILFPDGRLPSPRWRPLAVIGVLVVGLAATAAAVEPGVLVAPGSPRIRNPLGIEAFHVLPEMVDVLLLAIMALILAGILAIVVRLRRSRGEERQQVKWLVYPAAVAGVGFAIATVATVSGVRDITLPVLIGFVGLAGIPVAAGIAILKHRLLDIDLIIRRSLVYGALWLLIGLVYVGVAAAFGVTAGARLPLEVAILLTIAATLLFQPLRRRLDRLAGRIVFGDRPTRYELLTRFGETLEHAFDPTELAPRVAATVQEGLGLRWARVRLRLDDEDPAFAQPAGAAGVGLDDDTEPEVSIPLIHGGEEVGTIECGPKVEGRFTSQDHVLLGTLARQAALGIRNARLAAELSARLDEIRLQAQELSASRARIVHAQDEERRRLERNIHDGVQQEMVSLMAKLRLARNQLKREPTTTDALLIQLQSEARQTLDDLRELARGIHPPVLTDRGLLEAIEARTARFPVGVAIHADVALRESRFAPDVEGAAYFFVSEALANAVKHASASRIVVRLRVDGDRLVVEVEDDGVGFVAAEATGSGLTGLRDRLEAVGGSLHIATGPGEGTRLRADLPAKEQEVASA